MEGKLFFLLVDDHDTILTGLYTRIKENFPESVIYRAEEYSVATEYIKLNTIDIAVVDISFRHDSNADGIQLCEFIKTSKPEIKIICYTAYAYKMTYIKKLTEIGVNAIVSKNDGTYALITTVKDLVADKEATHSQEVLQRLFDCEKMNMRTTVSLTPREKEILILIHKHYTSKEIAEKLCRSKNTIDTHTKSLYRKYTVNKKSELIEKTRNLFD